MEKIVNIQNVDPNTFQLQNYSPSDEALISNYTEQDIAFDPSQDYVEYFVFDLNQRIDSKSRSMLDVMKSKKEYAEVIGYRLAKYEGNTNTLIQEWYLPNVGEGQMSWVDSQIKYDKLYTYKLDLIVLTFATEYRITSVRPAGNKLATRMGLEPTTSCVTGM